VSVIVCVTHGECGITIQTLKKGILRGFLQIKLGVGGAENCQSNPRGRSQSILMSQGEGYIYFFFNLHLTRQVS
jgi:hypothetical protein